MVLAAVVVVVVDLSRTVAKRINLPAHARDIAKLVQQEAVAQGSLVNHGGVVRAALVMLGPAAIHKLQLMVLHKGADSVTCRIVLLIPPAGKVRLPELGACVWPFAVNGLI